MTSGNGAKRGSNILLLLFADVTIVVVPYTSAPARIARAIRFRHSQKSLLRLRGEQADWVLGISSGGGRGRPRAARGPGRCPFSRQARDRQPSGCVRASVLPVASTRRRNRRARSLAAPGASPATAWAASNRSLSRNEDAIGAAAVALLHGVGIDGADESLHGFVDRSGRAIARHAVPHQRRVERLRGVALRARLVGAERERAGMR